MKRSVVVATAAAMAALAAGVYWLSIREIAVRTLARETNVEIRAFGVGTVEAQILSKVGFQIGGKVAVVAVDQGELVKAGELLARLHDDAQRARVAKADVAVRQAAASLLKVETLRGRSDMTYQQKKSVNARRQTLVSRGAVSQEAADDTQVAEEIAGNDLKVADADVAVASVLRDDAAAQRNIEMILLDQHELRAPFEARVIARYKEAGSIANAGEPVFTLIEPQSIWVRAHIDEAQAGGLAIGQDAFVRLRSEQGSLYRATIVRIDQESDRVTEERRIYVRCVDCAEIHNLRFLGEQAEVEILKKVVAEGLFVPARFVEAISGNSATVWVAEAGRLRKLKVELGERTLDGRIEVTSRLPDGSVIVAERGDHLREGRRVRPAAGS